MSKQPEALRLAEYHEHALNDSNDVYEETAAELRRLHAVNAELLEALQALLADPGDDHIRSSVWNKARAAVQKATGDSNA